MLYPSQSIIYKTDSRKILWFVHCYKILKLIHLVAIYQPPFCIPNVKQIYKADLFIRAMHYHSIARFKNKFKVSL